MNLANRREELSSFTTFLKTSLGPLIEDSALTFIDMVAPDVIFEFPFAPAGLVTRLDGKAALSAHLQRFGNVLQIDGIEPFAVHTTGDQNVRILEFSCVGKGLESGRPYNQRYISVITARDGLIVRYVDYWNPLIVLDAIGKDSAMTQFKHQD
jgi:ketosteroid isomerase-like protein